MASQTLPQQVRPCYPVIYVRGYAMTQGAIENTVNTPYMGFNLGSTRIRQQYNGSYQHYMFESPLIRLMKEYGYQDTYSEGINLAEPGPDDFDVDSTLTLPMRSVVIHRYYESEFGDPSGSAERTGIIAAAERLSRLIARVRQAVRQGMSTDEESHTCKVYLVAHSMGGLICRCLLQNSQADVADSAQWVDKVFTYGTPHNGIEMLGVNVPRFLGAMDMNNFNRHNMSKYLALQPVNGRVNHLNGRFPPQRFFCFVGTNPHDYNLARLVVEKASDGLVTIDNAVIKDAPRAYSYTSHSGHYGMVNSKEGYDNLVRFLFGDYRLMITMRPEVLPLPPLLQDAYEAGARVRGSYHFECSVKVRGDDPVALSCRRIDQRSAVFRSFDELLRPEKVNLTKPRYPVLASVFLDSSRIEVGKTMVLSLDVEVSSTDFRVNGRGISKRRLPDEHVYRECLVVKITLTGEVPRIRYILADQHWSDGRGKDVGEDEQGTYVPLSNGKGFVARLYLDLSAWR